MYFGVYFDYSSFVYLIVGFSGLLFLLGWLVRLLRLVCLLVVGEIVCVYYVTHLFVWCVICLVWATCCLLVSGFSVQLGFCGYILLFRFVVA